MRKSPSDKLSDGQQAIASLAGSQIRPPLYVWRSSNYCSLLFCTLLSSFNNNTRAAIIAICFSSKIIARRRLHFRPRHHPH